LLALVATHNAASPNKHRLAMQSTMMMLLLPVPLQDFCPSLPITTSHLSKKQRTSQEELLMI